MGWSPMNCQAPVECFIYNFLQLSYQPVRIVSLIFDGDTEALRDERFVTV